MEEYRNCNLTENTASDQDLSILDLLKNLDINTVNSDNKESRFLNVISMIVSRIGAEHGYIMLNNTYGNLKNVACKFSSENENLITASPALIKKVMDTGETAVVEDALKSDEFKDDSSFQRFNISSAVCVPVKTDEETYGVIYVDSSSGANWDSRDISLLEVVADYAGLAVVKYENKRLVDSGKATLNLSHSVKNILQMISGAAEVIDYGLKKNKIKRVKRSWQILRPNLDRLRKFMLDMLDYSKDRKIELGPCNFNETIKSSVELLKDKLHQIDSTIVIVTDPKMPVVELDSERIHEMSLNLILNAIDIVDQSKGIVKAETRYFEEDKVVKLMVTDNGPGMTEEVKNKIFTPFESGKNKLGTGLGMAIAKQIIDQHEGTIEIDSKIGEGTTFTVTLPARVYL